MRLVNRFCFAVLAGLVLVGSALGARDPGASAAWPSGTAVVSYESEQALAAALDRHPARVVRRIGALRVAALRPQGNVERYARLIGAEPGIVRVERAATRVSRAEPALFSPQPGLPYQWQYSAVRADQVPAAVAQAAAGLTIAVIDTGADLGAPDLSAKAPQTFSIRKRLADVPDANGHGTFVAALAAGSSTNGDGIAGVGGEAGLMVVQAGGPTGAFTDVDEAAAIVYAVDHGARIVNLSLGGSTTSSIEKRAVDYAVAKGALWSPPSATATCAGTTSSIRRRCCSRSARRVSAVAGSRSQPRTGTARGLRSPAPARTCRWRPGRRRLQRRLLRVAVVELSTHRAPGRARRRLRLRQRDVVRGPAGGRRGRARLGREPAAAGGAGGVDPRADGLRTGQLERRARLRRPRRRGCGGEGADARWPRSRQHRAGGWRRRSPAARRARSRRARSRRRGRAGARRSARSRGRSRRRCRSSTSPPRRGPRSAAPSRRGCPGSSAARRRAARGR